LRNSYAVDVDDAGVALTGYKARDESEICYFYQRGQTCKRGSSCPYKHIKPSSDGQTTDKKAVMYSSKTVELPAVGTTVGVEVTAAMSASHFYVNFPVSSKHLPTLAEAADDCQKGDENLKTLWDKLQKAYKDNPPRDGDYLLRGIGEIVVAKFSKDNCWYRARVIDRKPEISSVKVFFVDYGNSETVPESRIRDIRPEFLHFPFQAVECRLAKVELYRDPNKMRRALTIFKNEVDGKNMTANVVDVIGDTLFLELFASENESDLSINLSLLTLELARPVSDDNLKSKIISKSSKKLNIMPA